MQVPGLDNNPQFNTNVPGVALPRRQEFTEVGQAYERTGEQLENAAHTGAEIYDEVQRQHDISTANTDHVDATLVHGQILQNLKQTSPDGFMHDPDTNEIQKNSDGSQRTIAQEYWDRADSDYQNRQDNMTPRAAAMFREKMQPEIMRNTQYLQAQGALLQTEDAKRNITDSVSKMALSNDQNPWVDGRPSTGAYYPEKQPDGSMLLRGNTDKINDQLRTIKLMVAQHGPVDGKSGAFTPDQVSALTNSLLSSHAEDFVHSALRNISESDAPRDARNALNTQALLQIHDLRDKVDGKDPQSVEQAAKGLPTINSSLTADQRYKLGTMLDAFKPEAQEIDKSDHKLALNQLKDYANSVRSVKELVNSPLFNHAWFGGVGLGLTPAERVDEMSSIVAEAANSSGIAATSGVRSAAAKQAATQRALNDFRTFWPQFSQNAGVKDTQGFGDAIMAKASAIAAGKLKEDERAWDSDPMKMAASIQQGPQGPGGMPQYTRPMAHAIQDALDHDPSALFNKMANGKSVFENSQSEANKVVTIRNGAHADVAALQKGQFEDQTKRLLESKNPARLEDYFVTGLGNQNVPSPQKEAFLQHMHTMGGMPQTYIDALNLKTPAERATRWTELMSGGNKEWTAAGNSQKQLDLTAQQENAPLAKNLRLIYGENSPLARNALNSYMSAWKEDYKNANMRGLTPAEAKYQANKNRDSTMGEWGTVGATHTIAGYDTGISKGPQVPVQYGRSDLTTEQKQNINTSLLHFASKEELSKYEFVKVPGSDPANANAPTQPEWVANHVAGWKRIPGGYRMLIQGMSPAGQMTGNTQEAQIVDSKGAKRYLDIQDADAQKVMPGLPQAAAPHPSWNKLKTEPGDQGPKW